MNDRVTLSEISNDGQWRVAAVTGRAPSRGVLRARFRIAAALAALAAASSGCGDDPTSPAAGTSMQPPQPPTSSTNPPGMADPAPASPAPSPAENPTGPADPAPGAAGESMGEVPLEAPSANDEGDGVSPDGEERPPATDGETPSQPPPAFNPCPTDGTPCRIMPLGDSITDGLVGNAPGNTTASVGGYRVELFRRAVADGHAITFVGRQANGPNTDIEGQPFPRNHEGYSGFQIQQLADTQVDAALAAGDPDIILLHIGTNNLYQGMAPAVPGQLGALLDQLTEGAPDALVVVAQITPLGGFPANGVSAYNAAIPALVQERVDAGKHLIVVDQFTPIASQPNFAAQFVGDTIHPNAAGYAIMAETWYEALESFLPVRLSQ